MKEKRIRHLDLVKCIALPLMVFFNVYGHMEYQGMCAAGFPSEGLRMFTGLFYNIVPASLMICMGSGIVKSSHTSPEALFRRGADIVKKGLSLNLIRFTAVFAIIGVVFSDPFFLKNAWYWFWASDILPFAGMSLMIFSGIRGRKHSAGVALCLGLGMSVLNSILGAAGVFSALSGTPAYLLGNVFRVEKGDSFFPLSAWFIFPALGYAYETACEKVQDPDRFHGVLGVSCALLLGGSILILKKLGAWKERYLLWGVGDFKMDLPTTWFVVLINGIYFPIAYGVCRLLKGRGKKMAQVGEGLARLITPVYCIHWVLLMLSVLFCKLKKKKDLFRRKGSYSLFCGVLFVVSVVLSLLWGKVTKKPQKQKMK